jgi:lipopolysaccharide heptosyltransferase I
MQRPRAIVIVKLSAIGDVLHGVPVAVALKRAFPDARIGWTVEGRAADLLAGHPAIDHLFRLPRGWLKSPRTVLSLRRQLRWFGADVAIDLQGLLKSGVATLLSGAGVRIGHARPASREAAWLASTHPVAASSAHVVDRNLELVTPLRCPGGQPAFDMPTWPVSRLRVQRWLSSLRLPRPPVLFNPGAGWQSKRWPEDRFAAAARALARHDGQPVVVVWGGATERAAAERIVAESSGGALAAPATSLTDLGELCRLARVFVSGDTGPLHLAAAVGTPCVGLFGPVPASRNGPYGPGHVCVEPPAAVRPPWSERKTDTAAMAAIEVESVVAATESALARCRAA